MDEDTITILNNKRLFGFSGGQLEYVSQRLEWRQSGNGHCYQVMVIRFTDHDIRAVADIKDIPHNKNLIDGKYYELEFPLSTD